MKQIDAYYQPNAIDCFTIVTDEGDELTGYRVMLALGHNATVFSQWTEGYYEEDGDNSHLGAQVCLIDKHLIEHIEERLREDGDGTH